MIFQSIALIICTANFILATPLHRMSKSVRFLEERTCTDAQSKLPDGLVRFAIADPRWLQKAWVNERRASHREKFKQCRPDLVKSLEPIADHDKQIDIYCFSLEEFLAIIPAISGALVNYLIATQDFTHLSVENKERLRKALEENSGHINQAAMVDSDKIALRNPFENAVLMLTPPSKPVSLFFTPHAFTLCQKHGCLSWRSKLFCFAYGKDPYELMLLANASKPLNIVLANPSDKQE